MIYNVIRVRFRTWAHFLLASIKDHLYLAGRQGAQEGVASAEVKREVLVSMVAKEHSQVMAIAGWPLSARPNV